MKGCLSTLRLITAVVTCSLSLRFVGQAIEYAKGYNQGRQQARDLYGPIEFNEAHPELRGQIQLLFLLLIVNGFLAGVI